MAEQGVTEVMNNKIWIGVKGKKHAFVYGRHGISRISACGDIPHPDLPVPFERDETKGLKECKNCDRVFFGAHLESKGEQ